MKNALSVKKPKIITGLKEFFSQPEVSALSQVFPLTAAIAAYFGGKYSQEQYETLEMLLRLLNERLQKVERRMIDSSFFESKNGKRVMGKVLRSALRDNRIEKLEALATLAVNVNLQSKLTLDEKEVYIDILDGLNVLQLLVLRRAVDEMRARTTIQHRGFGWELLYKDFARQGISKPLFLQSIRTLESGGLVNQNTATVQEEDKTHFITDFGEQFYDYISAPLTVTSHE